MAGDDAEPGEFDGWVSVSEIGPIDEDPVWGAFSRSSKNQPQTAKRKATEQ